MLSREAIVLFKAPVTMASLEAAIVRGGLKVSWARTVNTETDYLVVEAPEEK